MIWDIFFRIVSVIESSWHIMFDFDTMNIKNSANIYTKVLPDHENIMLQT
jgi:hypothetical protein